MNLVDLRSDTVTRPTKQMRDAMRTAEVGDDGRRLPDGRYGDPTVNALEAEAAEILGKDAALFVISGTMANFVALRTWCKRSDVAALGRKSHLYRKESAAFDPEFHGINALALPDETGPVDSVAFRAAITASQPKLLCLENTHNAVCGRPWSPEESADVVAAARCADIPIHLDGARIFNAAVALRTDVKSLADLADSVMFCLSKGLGAPLGSILAGSRDFIGKARDIRRNMGGQWRQAGIAAAAGRIALRDIEPRLNSDHEKARKLATLLGPALVDIGDTRTNMVQLHVSDNGPSAHALVIDAARKGILLHAESPTTIRLVTHQDVTDSDVDRVADVLVSATMAR